MCCVDLSVIISSASFLSQLVLLLIELVASLTTSAQSQAPRPTQPKPALAEWVPSLSWESKQAYRMIHQPVSRGLAVFAECLAVGLACGDKRRLTGSGSALEALWDDVLYKSTVYFIYFYHQVSHRPAMSARVGELNKSEILLVVREKLHVLSDWGAVAVILFHARIVMSYFRLFDWIFIIYFVIFTLKVYAYMCVSRRCNRAD